MDKICWNYELYYSNYTLLMDQKISKNDRNLRSFASYAVD